LAGARFAATSPAVGRRLQRFEDRMEDQFWTTISASLLAACVTTVGIYVIRNFEAWGRRNTTISPASQPAF
jgi:hypothetical protein